MGRTNQQGATPCAQHGAQVWRGLGLFKSSLRTVSSSPTALNSTLQMVPHAHIRSGSAGLRTLDPALAYLPTIQHPPCATWPKTLALSTYAMAQNPEPPPAPPSSQGSPG